MVERRSASRRMFLRSAGVLTGGALVSRYLPESAIDAAVVPGRLQTVPDPEVEKRRAQIGAAPIETTRLGEGIVLLSGPGGNVVVLFGREGKFVVDSFVLPAWPRLKSTLEGLD